MSISHLSSCWMCLSSHDCSQTARLDLVSKKFSTRAKQNGIHSILAVCYYLCNGFWKVIIYFRNWMTKTVYVHLMHKINAYVVTKNICEASQLLPRVQRQLSAAWRVTEHQGVKWFFFICSENGWELSMFIFTIIQVSWWIHFSCIHFSSSVF